MQIIGWVRVGDKAACGGTVIEGSDNAFSYDRAYTFQGARMNCTKHCVIAEGFPRATLSNGRARVIHGQRTSGLCPLISTLNDIDGVDNAAGGSEGRYLLDADGDWSSNGDAYDQQFQLHDEVSGEPLANRRYRLTFGGTGFEGVTDSEGKTKVVTAKSAVGARIEVLPEGE